MEGTFVIIVSDHAGVIENAKRWALSQGLVLKVYGTAQWAQEKGGVSLPTPSLAPSLSGSNNILPFPGQSAVAGPTPSAAGNRRVATMNELESIAIENAIYEYNGNLTEAARALGIGRATLYRKVKQYDIDPSAARKKRRAA